jgi:hypothetical protein
MNEWRRLNLHLLRRRLYSLLFGSFALKMCRHKRVLPALADIIGLLLRLLQREAHTSRRSQKLQKIIRSIISLLLGDYARRRGCGGSSRFRNLFHATIITSAEFLVHLQNPLSQLPELASTHVSVLLLKHAFKQVSLFADANRHATEHLLPAVPDTVIGMLHPTHIPSPVTLETIPATVEAQRSERTPIAIAIPERRHRRTSDVGWWTDEST